MTAIASASCQHFGDDLRGPASHARA